MAGLGAETPAPTELTLHRASRLLEIVFDDGKRYRLPCEYLRVYSPSAEVRGHGGPMQTVAGKRDVTITAIEPVGHYAVRLVFDDGHRSGLYSWDLLYTLGRDQDTNWQDYLDRLAAAGLTRAASEPS
ncbi:gamma-butyrobetaine hydroxylase-like domain-containing protein [Chitinimonas lacunae]|uniref:Gamma-butyrobetaine hydroxylase-like domain-containing protein n=1 Tax=Chitinimonas lacunae TaxID=1963018 RepID=A0ABV8MU15_9NEIS